MEIILKFEFLFLVMKKLKIIQRTNWENKFYLKIFANLDSMKTIKLISKEFGDDYFSDNQGIPKKLSDYEKWKDLWIPIIGKKVSCDIICGDRAIHLIFYKFPSFDFVNKVLDKYFEWEKE